MNTRPALTRRIHLSMSVRGALRNRSFECFTKADGTPATKEEGFQFLCDKLAAGFEKIPVCGDDECPNFDPKRGCPGHPIEDELIAAQVQALTREFRYGAIVLPDPNPSLSPAQVQDIYASTYPELSNAKPITDTKTIDGTPTRVITFHIDRELDRLDQPPAGSGRVVAHALVFERRVVRLCFLVLSMVLLIAAVALFCQAWREVAAWRWQLAAMRGVPGGCFAWLGIWILCRLTRAE